MAFSECGFCISSYHSVIFPNLTHRQSLNVGRYSVHVCVCVCVLRQTFQSSFRFIAKLRYRDFPSLPVPTRCTASPISMSPTRVVQFFNDWFYLFLERGEGREGEKQAVAPNQEPGPTTQACALTRNWTGDPSLCRMIPNPVSYTSQGKSGTVPTPGQPTLTSLLPQVHRWH